MFRWCRYLLMHWNLKQKSVEYGSYWTFTRTEFWFIPNYSSPGNQKQLDNRTPYDHPIDSQPKINGQNQSWLSCIRWSSCHQFGAIIWKPNRRNTRRIRAIRWASLRRFKSLHRISYLCSSSTWHHSVAFVSIQRVEFCSRLTRFYCFNWNTNHLCWWQLHKNQNFLKEGLTCLQVPTMSTKW